MSGRISAPADGHHIMKAEHRHELKEDAFVTFIWTIWAWAKAHSKEVMIGSAAVVVIAIIAFSVALHSRATDSAAWAALAKAERLDPSDNLDEREEDEIRELLIARMQEAGAGLAGTPAEPTYLKKLSDLLIGGEDYAEAEKVLTRLIDAYPKEKLIVTAILARGKARFELEDYGNAAEDFVKVCEISAGDGPNLELEPQAKWFEGSCHEKMGDLEKAAAAYKECIIMDRTPDESGSEPGKWSSWAERDLRNIRSGKTSTEIQKELDKPEEKKPADEKPAAE